MNSRLITSFHYLKYILDEAYSFNADLKDLKLLANWFYQGLILALFI